VYSARESPRFCGLHQGAYEIKVLSNMLRTHYGGGVGHGCGLVAAEVATAGAAFARRHSMFAMARADWRRCCCQQMSWWWSAKSRWICSRRGTGIPES